MKSNLSILAVALVCFTAFSSCDTRPGAAYSENTTDDLAAEMESILKDKMLYMWYPRIVDSVNGGFYTNFAYNWEKMPRQEKMIVSQARGVWTASKAAERYPHDKRYEQAAAHGYKFLRDTMWDSVRGGFVTYWGLDDEQEGISEAPKQAYGNAFALYALAAYYKITKSPEVLELAKRTFLWMDQVYHDEKYGGYFDYLEEDRQTANADNPRQNVMQYKDYNSSIHILEAFAELYPVWQDSLLKSRLKEMLHIVRDTITTEHGYMQLYFEDNWQAVSHFGESRDEVLKNLYTDHISFGHDIETAYLLIEAAHALGEEQETTQAKARKMIDYTIAHGFDKDFSGIFDGGYAFESPDKVEVVMKGKAWWSQAEALNALLLFSTLYPEETIYKDAFEKMWSYIKKNCIDFEYGDWYVEALDASPRAKTAPKAHAWKSNYHTSRTIMNCIDLLKKESGHR